MFRLSLLLIALLAFTDGQFHKTKSYTAKNTYLDFAPDQFGNLLVLDGEILKKLNAKGEQQAAYSNPTYGMPTSLSALDALNPILFYQESYTLVTLDNRLNESLRINFLESGFYDVTLVCQGDEDRIWVYDQAQDRLFDYNLINEKIGLKSLNITQLSGVENSPNQLLSTFNHIYLNVPEKGILQFTATAALEKIIPIKGITCFDVNDNKLYYLKEGKLNCFDLFTRKELPLQFKEPINQAFESVQVRAGKLYLHKGKNITQYKTTK